MAVASTWLIFILVLIDCQKLIFRKMIEVESAVLSLEIEKKHTMIERVEWASSQ
jgi:TRAP-type mannitol/chloroaromatic compound transport system permease small subunit